MFVDRDSVRLFYDIQGQGEPALVFLHGWLMSHEVWRNQVAYFAQHSRVVTLDLRGFGQSDKPAGEYTFEVFADDLHFLLQHLGIRQPVLIGWSKGASIGLVYAAAHPDDLAALVLVGGGPKFIATDDFIHGLPADVFAGLLGQFEADFSASVQDFISAMLPEMAGENPLKAWLFDLSRQSVPVIALNSIRNDARCCQACGSPSSSAVATGIASARPAAAATCATTCQMRSFTSSPVSAMPLS
jgi:pimeloyl-ACP methyl ester carboxylesterase